MIDSHCHLDHENFKLDEIDLDLKLAESNPKFAQHLKVLEFNKNNTLKRMI